MGPRQGRIGPKHHYLVYLGPTGPDGDPWRMKADFMETEGRRWGVWGRSPQQNGALWGPIGGPVGMILTRLVALIGVG